MFTRIVVGIDGSDHAFHALEYAAKIAQRFGASLRLVYAFPETSELLGSPTYDNLLTRRMAKGQSVLDEARQQIADFNLDVHEELLEGPAAEAILKVAGVREADLIVVGTRGLGQLAGLLLGSVSSKVARHARCPVMLVR